jgi:hypothetical protein
MPVESHVLISWPLTLKLAKSRLIYKRTDRYAWSSWRQEMKLVPLTRIASDCHCWVVDTLSAHGHLLSDRLQEFGTSRNKCYAELSLHVLSLAPNKFLLKVSRGLCSCSFSASNSRPICTNGKHFTMFSACLLCFPPSSLPKTNLWW